MLKWIEIPLIIVLLIVAAMWFDHWPIALGIGQFALYLALLFLFHTLLRDVALLVVDKYNATSTKQPRREAQCFCIESGIGVAMVVLGLLLFLSNSGGDILLSKTQTLAIAGILMAINYLLKDYVFSWNPWRIYRDPNHLNLIPRLRTRA